MKTVTVPWILYTAPIHRFTLFDTVLYFLITYTYCYSRPTFKTVRTENLVWPRVADIISQLGRELYLTMLHPGGPHCLAGEQFSSPHTALVVQVLVAVHLAHRIYVCCAPTIFHSLYFRLCKVRRSADVGACAFVSGRHTTAKFSEVCYSWQRILFTYFNTVTAYLCIV